MLLRTLIGRFDEKIVFRPLSPDTQGEIARLTIAEELARLRERGFDLTVSNNATIVTIGFVWHRKSGIFRVTSRGDRACRS